MISVRVQPRADGISKAFLVASCPLKGECKWPVWLQPAEGTMWQWNGNVDRPTVTPSIDCRGGCNQHFTVVDGAALT